MARTSRHTSSTFTRGRDYVYSDIEQTVRNLRAKGEHVLRAAKLALKQSADKIVDDAKSRCPTRTTDLKESIKAIPQDDGAAYEFTADAQNSSNVAYGQFVEFSPKINEAFLYPAFDANIPDVKRKVQQAIDNAVARGR